eukprot:TRINITY_DN790_c0_g2_i1.p1 TRINITY_DN790_c0_g2~~TRINITY_DN790_c0_g2_i1.p1  ORF type:complete len:1562 (+),score=282.97 TRINITY_DN790_c0_g2_i1:162-4847(+)
MASRLTIFFLFAVVQFFFAARFAHADNGLQFQTSTPWPQGTGANQVFGDPAGFLSASRDPTNGWTYWGTRDWIGVVADRNPSNTSVIGRIYINTDATSNPSYSLIELVTSGPLAGTGWFASINNQDLWRFNLSDPLPTPSRIYDRQFDNRLFRGILYEPRTNLFWIITDNDVFWINPALPAQPVEQPNPSNGLLQNIQNGASLRVILRQVVSGGVDNIVMAGNAIVFRTPVTNNGFTGVFRRTDLTSRQVGAGQYSCGAISAQQDVVYLGSDLGIGIEVNLDDLTLKRIFFAPGEIFLTVLYDPKGATFWSSNRGTVIRVNTIDFTIFARETVPFVSNLQAAVQDPATGLITYGANFGTDFNTYTVLKTDCNYDCARCLSFDRQYCGVCKATGVCTVNETCIISGPTDVWEQSGICPQSRSVNPASANTNGGTVVTIQGTYFERASDHNCVFFVSDEDYFITPVIATDTTTSPPTVTCTVPQIVGQAAGVATVQVGVRWGPQTAGPSSLNGTRDWGGLLPFQTYRCEAQNCDQCFSTVSGVRQFPECIWCVRSRVCSAAQACNSTFSDNIDSTNCPTIVSVNPTNSSAITSLGITINLLKPLPAELTYQCTFDSTPALASTVASTAGTTVTCPTPTAGSALPAATVITALSIADRTTSQRIVPRPVDFTLYNCSALQKCSDCLKYPTCGWCGQSLTCGPSASLTCGSTVTVNAGQCPRPTVAEPTSILRSDINASSRVALRGSNLETYTVGTCIWTNVSTSATAYTSPFYFIDSTRIECDIPTNAADGEYLISVANQAIPQTDSVRFLVYSCDVTSCVECLDSRRTKCDWCNSGAVGTRLKCGVIGSGSCTDRFTLNSSCPVASSVSPTGDSTDGNTQVTLTGTFLSFTGTPTNVSCEWLTPAGVSIARVPSTSASSTQVVCTTPAVSSAGNTKLRVIQDNIPYSTAVDFNFYNCSTATTCGSCLVNTLPNCRWCAVSGTASDCNLALMVRVLFAFAVPLAMLALLMICPSVLAETVLHVDASKTDDPSCGSESAPCASLSYVLLRHPTGGLTIVTHGDLTGNLNRDLLLQTPRNLTIKSGNGDPLHNVIDCGGTGRFLYVSASTSSVARHEITISGYSFTNCNPSPDPGQRDADGGVIKVIVAGAPVKADNQPRLSVIDCHFYENTANRGAAIFVSGVGSEATWDVDRRDRNSSAKRLLYLENVIFRNNHPKIGTVYSAAYLISASQVSISDTTGDVSAAIYLESSSTWWDDLEVSNTVSRTFSTVFVDRSLFVTQRLTMRLNSCRGQGTIDCSTCGLKLAQTQASNNSAVDAGFVWAEHSRVTVVDGHFYNNIASKAGGAFGVGAETVFEMSGALMESNFGGLGGAIHVAVNSKVHISRSRFLRNRANYGGAIAASNAQSVYLDDVEITDNEALQGGAGVFCSQSTFNLTRVNFKGNKDDMYCSEDGGATHCKILGDIDFSSVCANSLKIPPVVADRDNGGLEDPLILGLPLWAVVIIGTVVVTVVGVGSFVGIVTIVRRVKRNRNGSGVRAAEPDDAHQGLWSQLPTEADLDDDEGLQ